MEPNVNSFGPKKSRPSETGKRESSATIKSTVKLYWEPGKWKEAVERTHGINVVANC